MRRSLWYKRFNYPFVVIAIVFFVSSVHAANSDEFANIHTIGIISSIGDNLTLQKIGTFVWNNSQDNLQISDWGIDDIIVHDITAALGHRFIIKSVANDPDTFKREMTNRDHWSSKHFVSMPENQSIDAYIMVLPKTEGDPLGTSVQLTGLGVYHHNLMLGGERNVLFAIYEVDIVDAKTGDVIDYGSARVPDSDLISSPSPYRAFDKSLWTATAAEMTGEEKAEFKKKFVALIEESLPYAFHNANFPLF